MAKLPYIYTICPTQEAPKRFTASCAEMGILLSQSPDGDLTIDDRRNGLWESWEGKGVAAEPIEDSLHKIIRSARNDTTAKQDT
jgi:hypothetical protein